ncbi:MAG: PIN domain-containing protein [Thermomicrobia bacterium]|nr:PIN domain-containing protein [Thermomicrobia bacterium]MCA1725401.1 PIN domain-containing protein [Thermomicrobia bacterium]
MILILDASAMIAFLRDEPGGAVVETVLINGMNTCIAHAINLCEVYYDFFRSADEATAKAAITDLEDIGVIVREDMDRTFWQEVGRYKATNKASLADCAAIALTNRVGGELLTSDHHELDVIAANSICQIRFIR